MPGKVMHIGHDNSGAARRGGAANSLAPRNAYAGRLSLERAEHEFPLPREIEPGPVEFGQVLIDQRRHIGAVGDEVALTLDQRSELPRQLVIEADLLDRHPETPAWRGEDKPLCRGAGERIILAFMDLSRRTFLVSA